MPAFIVSESTEKPENPSTGGQEVKSTPTQEATASCEGELQLPSLEKVREELGLPNS